MFNLLKGGIKSAAIRLGYEIVRSEGLNERAFACHLRRLLSGLEVDCVLDVGANQGQYRKFLRDTVGYRGWIMSFEPLRSNIERLRSTAHSDPRWVIHGFALGRQNAYMDINVMRSDDFSSFLEPDGSLVAQFSEKNVVDHKERVEVRRLDSILSEMRASYPMERVYLKVDTQGFDLEVIDGAGDELTGFRALQMELSVRRIYEGAPDYQEALRTLGSKGFSVSGMFPISSDSAFRVVEFDCVLVNDLRLPILHEAGDAAESPSEGR